MINGALKADRTNYGQLPLLTASSESQESASDLRREWDLNPRGACTPKAFQGLRRLWLESAAPCLNRTVVTGVSLRVAWTGLSRLEIMAKFMATGVR